MTEREWLDQLKAGDQVIMSTSWYPPRLQKVEDGTKNFVTVAGKKFNRKYGREVGDHKGKYSIYQPTPEVLAGIERHAAIEKISLFVLNIPDSIPTAAILEAIRLLTPEKESK